MMALNGGVFQGLSHLVVEVGDLDAAEAFYRDGLGLQPIGRDAWPDAGANAVLKAGDQHLVLSRKANRPDLSTTGVHQGYRIGARGREEVRGRLQRLGVTVETYHEDRPAEARDNFYAFDPSGNRVQLVVDPRLDDGPGVAGIDHACVQDYDLQWAQEFYGGMLGLALDHVTGLHTDDYLRAQAWGDDREAMAPGCCRRVKYYREIPGQNRMQPRPSLQMYFRAGSGVIGVYMSMEDYAEPPEEQLVGTPRTALRVAKGKLDAVARALEARGRPFRGPIDHGGNSAIGRSLYSRDTGGNFIEFCEA
jgi:catechol 2,3-dioxygenase-like lactoylglutathione lyase family enzyme